MLSCGKNVDNVLRLLIRCKEGKIGGMIFKDVMIVVVHRKDLDNYMKQNPKAVIIDDGFKNHEQG